MLYMEYGEKKHEMSMIATLTPAAGRITSAIDDYDDVDGDDDDDGDSRDETTMIRRRRRLLGLENR